MIRLVTATVLAAILAAAPAVAAPKKVKHTKAGIALTTSAPSAAPTSTTDALPLAGLRAYRVYLCAESGQTLTGGTLITRLYGPDMALWSVNSAKDLTVGAPGTRCRHWDDIEVGQNWDDWVTYTTSSVTVSGGTTVSIYVVGVTL